MNDQDQEKDQLERRLAEQEVFRQTLAAKADRLAELEAEVTYLRRTLNGLLAVPRSQPAYTPLPVRTTPLPRRWKAVV